MPSRILFASDFFTAPDGTTACASTIRHAILARAEKLDAARRLQASQIVSLGAGFSKPPSSGGAPSAPTPL